MLDARGPVWTGWIDEANDTKRHPGLTPTLLPANPCLPLHQNQGWLATAPRGTSTIVLIMCLGSSVKLLLGVPFFFVSSAIFPTSFTWPLGLLLPTSLKNLWVLIFKTFLKRNSMIGEMLVKSVCSATSFPVSAKTSTHTFPDFSPQSFPLSPAPGVYLPALLTSSVSLPAVSPNPSVSRFVC